MTVLRPHVERGSVHTTWLQDMISAISDPSEDGGKDIVTIFVVTMSVVIISVVTVSSVVNAVVKSIVRDSESSPEDS